MERQSKRWETANNFINRKINSWILEGSTIDDILYLLLEKKKSFQNLLDTINYNDVRTNYLKIQISVIEMKISDFLSVRNFGFNSKKSFELIKLKRKLVKNTITI